jgi:hypothetical protein
MCEFVPKNIYQQDKLISRMKIGICVREFLNDLILVRNTKIITII